MTPPSTPPPIEPAPSILATPPRSRKRRPASEVRKSELYRRDAKARESLREIWRGKDWEAPPTTARDQKEFNATDTWRRLDSIADQSRLSKHHHRER